MLRVPGSRGLDLRALAIVVAAAAVAGALGLLPIPNHDGATRAVARAGAQAHARAGRAAGAQAHARAGRAAGGHLGHSLTRARKPSQVQVAIVAQSATVRLPRSFLGISTEYWALPQFERHVALFDRALALVHVQGDGPLVVRIGGDSADHTFWDPMGRNMPHWVFKLTPAWLRPTAVLVRRLGVRVILDLNLVTGSPIRAAEWAHAAESKLPHRSIVAFEIGNEPDIYSRWFWLATLSRTTLGATLLPTGLSPGIYSQIFRAYAESVAQVAPGVPLIGPAVANPALDVNWISNLIDGAHPGLRTVSAHQYPLSACVSRKSAVYPTIARLLSERSSAGIARTVSAAVRIAHGAGLLFRMTELNSVTCGGRPGVSDAFATALWAPDALFELLQAGVDGVNVHVRADAINAAFALGRTGLTARPLLYGMILFARTLGPDAQLVHVRMDATGPSHLKVWAVRVRGDVLHVLLLNKGDQAVSARVRLPVTGPAVVERLLAPSPASRSGETLGGQRLGRDGRWRGRPQTESIMPGSQGYQLTIPRASAALLRVPLRPGSALSPAPDSRRAR
jgi:hypothetical protein